MDLLQLSRAEVVLVTFRTCFVAIISHLFSPLELEMRYGKDLTRSIVRQFLRPSGAPRDAQFERKLSGNEHEE